MNWEYISGFFDADGSIFLVQNRKKERKTVVLSFTNTEKIILEEIQKFILDEISCKGFISCKKAKKDTHKDSYDLKYSNLSKCLKILDYLTLEHPKKQHRKNITFKLKEYTPANGKYTEEISQQRTLLEQIFIEMG